jgi:O-antigen ligase
MLLNVAIGMSALSLLALAASPMAGLILLFISKPLIDTTFAQPLLYGFRLTEIVGALVPLAILGHMLMAGRDQSLGRMPLKGLWLFYAADVFIFSLLIVYHQDLKSGANVFLRHINGFIGFYMVQAFFHEERKLKTLLMAMLVAGLFPIGVGLYQLATGTVWIQAQAEGLTRNIGLYHDAFTVRAYAFQTLLALLLYGALYVRSNPLVRAGIMTYAVLVMVVMLKAYSKAGILALALWALCWTALQRKYLMLSLLIAGAVGAGVLYSTTIVTNLVQLFHKEIGALGGKVEVARTLQGRWYGWQEMIAHWSHLPWFNKLLGSGEVAVGAHNDYLLVLFHGGLVGLCLYVLLLGAVGFRIVRHVREKADPLAVASLMLLLMWLVDTIGLVPSAYPGYQWFVWGLIGLSLRLRAMPDQPALEEESTQPALVLPPLQATARRFPIIS